MAENQQLYQELMDLVHTYEEIQPIGDDAVALRDDVSRKFIEWYRAVNSRIPKMREAKIFFRGILDGRTIFSQFMNSFPRVLKKMKEEPTTVTPNTREENEEPEPEGSNETELQGNVQFHQEGSEEVATLNPEANQQWTEWDVQQMIYEASSPYWTFPQAMVWPMPSTSTGSCWMLVPPLNDDTAQHVAGFVGEWFVPMDHLTAQGNVVNNLTSQAEEVPFVDQPMASHVEAEWTSNDDGAGAHFTVPVHATFIDFRPDEDQRGCRRRCVSAPPRAGA